MTPRATLLLGPSRAGKSRRLLQRYAGRLTAGARCVWLAPNAAAVGVVRDALAGAANHGRLDPGVATFAGFARQLLVRGRVMARALSPAEARRLIHHAIAAVRSQGRLKHFAQVADAPGFAAQIGAFIADAKRRDAWAEPLQKAARNPRDRELAAIYGEYQRLLAAARAFDAEGLFWAARDAVKREPALLADIDLAVVDGFNDFTAAQYEILQRLAAGAESTVISLTIDETAAAGDQAGRPDLFARSLETLQALSSRIRCEQQWIAGQCEAPAELQSLPRRMAAPAVRDLRDRCNSHGRSGHATNQSGTAGVSPSRDVFCHIATHLFGEGETPVADATPVEIIAAPSVQRELEEVARRVKTLLVAGEAPDDIVIAFRHTAEHATRVRSVLADYGIPGWIDARPALAAAPAVRSLLNLLRLHAEDWPYRRLLAAATDRQIHWGCRESTAEVASRAALEYAIRAAQIAGGCRDLIGHVEGQAARLAELPAAESAATSDESSPDNALQSAALALPQLGWLRDLLGRLPKQATLEQWIEALSALATASGILRDDASEEDGDRVSARSILAALAAGWEAAWRADCWAGRADASLDVHEFVALAAAAAADATAPGGGDPAGRVRVVGAEQARHLRPRHLFVAGLAEQSFPAPARDDRQGDEDRLRQWLGESDVESLPPPAEKSAPAAAEMLLFYQLVNRPTASLTLSFPALDDKAQAMPPSPYVTELERCLPPDFQRTTARLAASAPPSAAETAEPASISQWRRSAVAAALDESPALLAAMLASPAAAATARSLAAGLECVAARSRRDAFGAWEGVLAGEPVRADFADRYGGEHVWSPSRLESYALCPFKFFAEGELRLQPAPELALRSDVGRRGVMLHETLAALHRSRAAAGDDEHVPSSAEELAALREQLIAEYRQSLAALAGRAPQTGLEAALWEIERRQLDSWAEQFADQELSYRGYYSDWDVPPQPRYFEARFGPGSRRSESDADALLSTDKPYELQLPAERLRLTGQIDRIDVGRVAGRTAFNVIDYKTSARAAVKSDQLEDGRQLQLPLYAMAAEELLLAAQDAVAWSAGYWSVQGKGLGKPGSKSGPLPVAERGDGGVGPTATWTSSRELMLQRIAEIVAGVRRAEFPVFSADRHCTSYCPLRTACRIGHVRSLQKTWQGEAVSQSDDGEEE